MKIYISGSHPKVSNSEIRYAVNWFSWMLMGPRLHRATTLFVKIENCGKLLGSAYWIDDNTNPREFQVDMNIKQSRKSFLMTLAHELVHVKQYAKGELKTLFNKREMRWKGEYFSENQMHYFDQPWEIEAFGRELGLFLRYKKHLQVEKINPDKTKFNLKKFTGVKRSA